MGVGVEQHEPLLGTAGLSYSCIDHQVFNFDEIDAKEQRVWAGWMQMHTLSEVTFISTSGEAVDETC